MIDFHCHIDLFPNPSAVISEAQEKGVYVLAVTTTPKSWQRLQQLLVGQKRIRAAIGLHPELVAERHDEVEELRAIAAQTKYIGEVGLDGSPQLKSSWDLQKKVFGTVLQIATDLGGKILSIHSRRAATAVLDCLEQYPKAGPAVLHWFWGTKAELQRAIKMGVCFSVGPAMLASAKGRELLAAMPSDRILTETDGPFAALEGKALGPIDVSHAERQIAEIWDVPLSDAQRKIFENFKILVGGIDSAPE